MQAKESQTGQDVKRRLASVLHRLATALGDPSAEQGANGVADGVASRESLTEDIPALRVLIDRLTADDDERRDTQAARLARAIGADTAPEQTDARLASLLSTTRAAMARVEGDGPDWPALEGALQDEVTALRDDLWARHLEQLQDQAVELRTRLEAVLNLVSEPVLVVQTPRGWIRDVNLAAAELTGLSASRLRTMSLSELFPNAGGGALRAFWSQVTEGGIGELADITLVTKEGTAVACCLVGSLVRVDGAPAAMCFLREAGDQVMSRAALQVRTHELQSAVTSQVAEIDQLRTFMENVISALPIRLVVLDSDLRIIHANPAYYVQRGLPKEEVVGRPVDEVFPDELLETAGLRGSLMSVIETGERVRWSGYRDATPRHGERVLNVRLDPCEGPDGGRTVLVTFEDITERHTQLYERTLLHQISRAMLGELNLDKLLHLILTGMTAGGAVGLGFNRAILMLVDEEAGVLRAAMAVGPGSMEQAMAIWAEVSQDHRTLQDFLADYHKLPPPDQQPLADLVEGLVVPLDDSEFLPMAAVVQQQTIHVVDAEMDNRVRSDLSELLGTNEFVVAPLVARDKIIGAAIADNRFSHQPIDHAAVQLLTALADQAALAIDTARTFQRAKRDAERLDIALRKLEAAQEQQLRSTQLAAIGEVTAIVAHEIRSPLSTIGGFARSIAREPDLVERSARNAKIIVDEVVRLEGILGELLDFSRPAESKLVLLDLVPLVTSLADQVRQGDGVEDVDIVVDVPQQAPPILADQKQVRQIIINLVNNALQAMPHGGTLTLSVSVGQDTVDVAVEDTGEGMSPDRLARIFDAFYTTKPTGTGLGLALCQKLAAQHGAEVGVQSEIGVGTTFFVKFPIPQGRPDDGAEQQGLAEG